MAAWLLIDSENPTLRQAPPTGLDGVVIDLTLGTAAAEHRRSRVAAALEASRQAGRPVPFFVGVHAFETGMIEADLASVMPGAPDGIMLPACRSGQDIQHLGSKLAVLEAEHGIADGATRIMALAGARAQSLLMLSSFVRASPRLAGLVWDQAALADDLGLEPGPGPGNGSGQWSDLADSLSHPLAMARALAIFTARAASVPAIVKTCGLSDASLAAAGRRARRDGCKAALIDDEAQVAAVAKIFAGR